MYHHPALLEALVRDRVAEHSQTAGTAAHIRPKQRPPKHIAAARHATGWLLVDMGLRLATPRAGMNRHVARARR